MFTLEEGEKKNYGRLLKYVEGKEFWNISDLNDGVFEEIGTITAKLLLFLEKLSE